MCKKILLEAVGIAGSQSRLAAGIRARKPGAKVSQAHVWKWLNSSTAEVPPAEYVIPIAETINWQRTPHQLRPDIYPLPTDGMPAGHQA